MAYTFNDALGLVDRESPASTDEQKIWMAETLLKLMKYHNDSPERCWLYWDGYYDLMQIKNLVISSPKEK